MLFVDFLCIFDVEHCIFTNILCGFSVLVG